MHHKRHRPKNRRSGCLMCKPHKMNGYTKTVKVKGVRCRRALLTLQQESHADCDN